MRIGILADIHEDVEALGQALGLLRREGAGRLVVLGDLFYEGRRVAEVAGLLAQARGSCDAQVRGGCSTGSGRRWRRSTTG
jgi:predicted phosphodiesterase